MRRYFRPIIISIVVYVLVDNVSHFLLDPLGLENWHATIAMFSGMFFGGYIARYGFIAVALSINLFFSLLTYAVVASMREQSMISLILEQSLLISIGSFIGAALGAWVGQIFASKDTR